MVMKKKILLIVGLLLCVVVIVGYTYYQKIFSVNVRLTQPHSFLYIKTGSNFSAVVDSLKKNNMLINYRSFAWLAAKMNYDKKIISGRYKITNGLSNREFILLLRSGRQSPVNFTFNNIRTKQDFVRRVAQQLEADSTQLLNLISRDTVLSGTNFTPQNMVTLFIPNTYQVYWNTSAARFFSRMHREYLSFWNEQRKAKAKATGLSQVEVTILASIVEQETKKNDEKPVVAGVYLNRLNQNWHLEADPTLVFASGDFTIKRVLNQHKQIDSPYNTYKYAGLPPGPICIPETSSIDAVLNFTHHDYMYFCARADMSGYHAFAKDYNAHLANAKKYQSELNKRNIHS